MDEGYPPIFFFAETWRKVEDKKGAYIDRLYVSIKNDDFKDSFLSEKISQVGKERLAADLCKRLNLSINELHEMDLGWLWRHIYAMHVEKAFQLKRSQVKQSLNK